MGLALLLDEACYNEDSLMEKLSLKIKLTKASSPRSPSLGLISFLLKRSMEQEVSFIEEDLAELRKKIYPLVVINYIKTYFLYRNVVFKKHMPFVNLDDVLFHGTQSSVQGLIEMAMMPALDKFLLDPDLLWLYEESVRLKAGLRIHELKEEFKEKASKREISKAAAAVMEMSCYFFTKKPQFLPEKKIKSVGLTLHSR